MPLPVDSTARKSVALYRGVLRYFPDALAYVAQISWAGNEKHNPGQEINWSRAKSGDELDCVARHLIESGTIDPEDGFWHDGKLAWRALANLQKHLERVNNLPISPGSTLNGHVEIKASGGGRDPGVAGSGGAVQGIEVGACGVDLRGWFQPTRGRP